MTKKIKAIWTFLILTFYYVFDGIIYPELQGMFALAQADNGDVAFVGLQMIAWLYTWMMPILFVALVLLWLKEIKEVYSKFSV